MKKEILTMTMAAGLACCSLLPSGCSTAKGVKTSESAVSSMQDIENLLKKGNQQVATTMTSLNEIGKTINTNPKRAYKDFASNVTALEDLSKEIGSYNEKMKAKADEHYALWEQELQTISNPTLKQQSSERREKVMTDFRSLQESFDGLRIAFRPYVDDVKDLVTFLGTDLNPHGFSAAGSMITGLKAQAVGVQRELNKVSVMIGKLRSEMAVQQTQQ
jgi:seryl-tRNA synthetase